MATVIQPPATPPPAPAARSDEQMVDDQIRRTRRSLKLVDWWSGMLTLLIGVLLYLLSAAVLDQWVIPGGWGTGGRIALLVVLLAGVAWYSWRNFWPLLSRPINPAFAAQVIERHSPSLKNSLLNFLLLRTRRQQLSQKVYDAIEQQAAQRLAQISLDSVIDRSALLRLGYILLAVIALCAAYRVLSPKDLTDSVGRVLLPWSDIAVPSRVRITNITPGDTSLARGEQLAVSAEIEGLAAGEPVEVHYSSLDKQIVDRRAAMSAAAGGARYDGKLPDRFSGSENAGVQQDLEYWIEAGDAKSPTYRVSVFARPTLVVDRVRYQYPAYTRLPSREVEGTGDISALEGTKVTVSAQANYEIAHADVDFEADGKPELAMTAQGNRASVDFVLALKEDRRTPQYDSYVLRYTTANDRNSILPPKYRVDVTPDYAPELRQTAPVDADGKLVEQLDVPVDQTFTIEVEARDPDFALRTVAIQGEVEGQHVLDRQLLSDEHTGRFVGRLATTPAELGLKAGDTLYYWCTATDNRQPEANTAQTERRRICVLGPPQFNQQPPRQNQQPGDKGEGESDSQDGEQGEGEQGLPGSEPGESTTAEGTQGEGESASADGEQGESEQGESSSAGGESQSEGENQSQGESASADGKQGDNSTPSEKVPTEGDDGTAFERIADHLAEKDAQEKDAGESSQQGESASADGEHGEHTEGENQTPGKSASADGESQSEDQGAEGQPNDEAGEQPTEPQQGDQQAPGGETSDEQGEPGESASEGEPQGSPDNPPRDASDKNQQEPGKSPAENQEPPGQAQEGQESDSEGGESGDKSGGGREGAGQQSQDKGTGTAGQNTPADEGGESSEQSGTGENANRPGNQGETASEGPAQNGESSPTGESASAGGEQGEGESGSKGGEQGDQTQGEPGSEGGTPSGGGTGNNTGPPPPPEELSPAEAANLAYAREQTDLVIERLEDQLAKKDVDQSLLEKLGWSAEDLQRFVDRWKKLKADAEAPGAEGDTARDQLDDALRSLGLSPDRRMGFRSQALQEKLQQLKDAYRGRTPLEYADQVRAYSKGIATADEDGEK